MIIHHDPQGNAVAPGRLQIGMVAGFTSEQRPASDRNPRPASSEYAAKAGPGSIVFIPRTVVHRFKNVGDTTGRMLGWSLPGGQDNYLKAISELAAGGGFTGEKVTEISKTFDTHFPCRA